MDFTSDNVSISSSCYNFTSVSFINAGSICLDLYLIASISMFVVVLPFNIWALLLSRRKRTIGGRSASPDILTLSLFYASVIRCILYFIYFIHQNYSFPFDFETFILFDHTGFMAQAQFHSWICVEHCLAVVFPIFYLKLKQFRYRLAWVSFTWISSLIFGVIVSQKLNIPNWLYSVPYSLMLLVILICNLATLIALRQPSPGDRERREMHLLKVKAFKIISLTLFILVISYYPYILVLLLQDKLSHENACMANAISFLLFLPGCIIHSLLYLSKFNKVCTSLI